MKRKQKKIKKRKKTVVPKWTTVKAVDIRRSFFQDLGTNFLIGVTYVTVAAFMLLVALIVIKLGGCMIDVAKRNLTIPPVKIEQNIKPIKVVTEERSSMGICPKMPFNAINELHGEDGMIGVGMDGKLGINVGGMIMSFGD